MPSHHFVRPGLNTTRIGLLVTLCSLKIIILTTCIIAVAGFDESPPFHKKEINNHDQPSVKLFLNIGDCLEGKQADAEVACSEIMSPCSAKEGECILFENELDMMWNYAPSVLGPKGPPSFTIYLFSTSDRTCLAGDLMHIIEIPLDRCVNHTHIDNVVGLFSARSNVNSSLDDEKNIIADDHSAHLAFFQKVRFEMMITENMEKEDMEEWSLSRQVEESSRFAIIWELYQHDHCLPNSLVASAPVTVPSQDDVIFSEYRPDDDSIHSKDIEFAFFVTELNERGIYRVYGKRLGACHASDVYRDDPFAKHASKYFRKLIKRPALEHEEEDRKVHPKGNDALGERADEFHLPYSTKLLHPICLFSNCLSFAIEMEIPDQQEEEVTPWLICCINSDCRKFLTLRSIGQIMAVNFVAAVGVLIALCLRRWC